MREHVSAQSKLVRTTWTRPRRRITDSLKVLLMYIELLRPGRSAPRILAGFLRDIRCKRSDWTKFEHMMWKIPEVPSKIFADPARVDYEDSSVAMRGRFVEVPLFSVNDSGDVARKVVEPMLKAYREG